MRRIQCETCPVRSIGPICELPQETLTDLRAAGSATVYRRNQVVFAEGQPAPGLYVVCTGAVKLYHADRFGEEHVVDIAQPGSVIGEVDNGAAARVSVSAEALTESQLLFVSTQSLPAFLDRHPEAAMKIVVALSRALGRTQRRLRDLSLKGAESRLAAVLLDLAGGSEGRPLPYAKRSELAGMVGVATETVIRLLAKLASKGLVAKDRRSLVIRDPERLRRIAAYDEA